MVHAIYIDFKKAFDSVPHHRLLYKLSRAGVRGKLLVWIRSFLLGRSQAVHVGEQQSAEGAVRSGVPQGSVLDSIYVNDSTNELDCDVAMLANDIKIWSTIRSEVDEARLQTNLDHLEQWSKDWLLPFNVNKCNFLRVGGTSSPNRTVYRLTGKPLQEVDAQKDLGVWITTSLKPSLQCSKVAKSAMSILYLVKRAFSSFDENCLTKCSATRAWHTGTVPINRCVALPAAYQALRAQLSKQMSRRAPILNMNPDMSEYMADTHSATPQPGSDEGAVLTTAAPSSSPADKKTDSRCGVNKIAGLGRQLRSMKVRTTATNVSTPAPDVD
nr:unnamed protein product [Spirometra erinaceieuropaei]